MALDEAELLYEAFEEHHVVHHLLIDELKKMTAGDERFDAKFTVLAEQVRTTLKRKKAKCFRRSRNRISTGRIWRRKPLRPESTFPPSRPDPENRKTKNKVALTQPRLQEGGYGNGTEDRSAAVIGFYD